MKNKTTIFALFLFISASLMFYVFYPSDAENKQNQNQIVEKVNKNKNRKPKFFKDIVSASKTQDHEVEIKKPQFVVLNEEPKKTVRSCKSSLDKPFVNFDLEDEEVVACWNFIMSEYQNSLLGMMLHDCNNGLDHDVCDMIPFFMKIMVTALDPELENKDVQDLSDFVLASRIVWNINVNNQEIPPENLDKIVQYSDELIDRDPDVFDAYKAKALALFLKEYMHQDQSVEIDLEKTFDDIDTFEHDDSQIDELIMVRHALNGNLDAVEDVALSLLDKNPDDYLGAYYMAAVEWKEGNKDEAMRWLEEAREMAPNNTRVKDSLSKIQNAKVGDAIFSLNMNVKFEGVNE